VLGRLASDVRLVDGEKEEVLSATGKCALACADQNERTAGGREGLGDFRRRYFRRDESGVGIGIDLANDASGQFLRGLKNAQLPVRLVADVLEDACQEVPGRQVREVGGDGNVPHVKHGKSIPQNVSQK